MYMQICFVVPSFLRIISGTEVKSLALRKEAKLKSILLIMETLKTYHLAE